ILPAMSSAKTLLAQAVEAVNAGDFAAAADRFERAAAVIGGSHPSDAVAALESAARLRLMLDDLRAATAALARAEKLEADSPRVRRLRAEVIDRTGDIHARSRAWQAVAEVPDLAQRQFANIQLGTLARAVGEHARAARYFASALDDVPHDGDPLLRAELMLEVAIANTADNDHARAERSLADAERNLPADDHGLRARITGQRGIIALARGERATALSLAETARAAAVRSNDVTTYLAASSLIAMVHEQAG